MSFEELTPRHHQICSLLAQGYSNKRIARELGIAEPTVKVHLKVISGALGCRGIGRTWIAVNWLAWKGLLVGWPPATEEPPTGEPA